MAEAKVERKESSSSLERKESSSSLERKESSSSLERKESSSSLGSNPSSPAEVKRRGSFARFPSLRRSSKPTGEIKEGRWGECSEEQLKALEELKNLVPDRPARYDDVRLLRFLRARAFDLEKTKQFLLDDIKWRAEEDVDTVLQNYNEEEKAQDFMDYWPRRFHGFARDGLPISYERLGAIDAKGALTSFPPDTVWRYHIYLMEQAEKQLEECSARDGRPRDEGLYFVVDLTGLGWKQFYMPALTVFMDYMKLDANHYPEIVKKLIIINAPSIFPMFWRLIKPIMDPRTVEKTDIVGTNPLETLEREFEPSAIPRMFGGSCTCKDEKCIFGGGDITPSNEEGYKEVTVSARGVHEERLQVQKNNSTLAWEFNTIDYNIQFAVHHEDSKEEIVALNKVESQESTQIGSLVVKSGTYVFKWDNTHSMMRSKQLKYRVTLQDPVDEVDHSKKKKKKKKKKAAQTQQAEEPSETKEEQEEEHEEEEGEEEEKEEKEEKATTTNTEQKSKKKKKKKKGSSS